MVVALALQGIGGGAVITTLKAFIDQAPSALARRGRGYWGSWRARRDGRHVAGPTG